MEVVANDDLDPAALSVRIEPEFRNMAPREALDVTLRMGEPGDLEFAAAVKGHNAGDDVLYAVGDGCTLLQLATALGIDKRTARKRAERAGCTVWKAGGRTSSVRVSPPSGEEGEDASEES
jgi:hypothetical protein